MRELWAPNPKVMMFIRTHKINPNESYKKTQFAYSFNVDGHRCLFHVLTRQCVLTDDVLLPEKIDGKELMENECLRYLAEKHFYVSSKLNESDNYLRLLRLFRGFTEKEGYTTYTILPTTTCNAKCVYCFEEGMRLVTMSRDTVEQVIRFILKTRRKNATLKLRWFGGEPLVKPDTIDRICSELNRLEIPFTSNMTTNASLIDDTIVEKMKSDWHVNDLIVSMDCAEEEYALRKRYNDHKNHYWQVIETIDKLGEAEIPLLVRCNVDSGNLNLIPEFIEDLSSIITHKETVQVGFAPLYQTRETVEVSEIYKATLRANELVSAAGFGIRKAVAPHRLPLYKCISDGTVNAVVISPDGLLYNCYYCTPGLEIGDLQNGITHPETLKLFGVPDQVREKCRDCAFLPECTAFARCPVSSRGCKEMNKANFDEILPEEVKNRRCM